MNWLKPMMLMMVLGAILYGVYVVLNKGPAPEPPPGVSRDWGKPPDIQLGVSEDEKGGPPPMTLGRPGDRPASGAGGLSYPATSSFPPRSSDPRSGYAPSAAPPSDGYASGSAPQSDGSRSNSTAPSDPLSRGTSAGQNMPTTDATRSESSSAASAPPTAASQESFTVAMESAKSLLGDGKLVEALRKLTKWYNNAQLSSEESRQLNEMLSQLAGTVVYSRQHLLQPAYKVQSGDRLETIAAKYNVPWQLLAKINGIDDPNRLTPGDELKVVRGPFSAFVDLERRQMTLVVEDCYAGRFNLVAVGDLARNLDGSFEVGEKSLDGKPGGGGAARAPSSPIHHWVGLGNNMWIVGTSDPASIHPAGLNLNTRDAEDVYDILSMGSRVVVRR